MQQQYGPINKPGAPNCLAGVGESSSFTQRSARAESGAHIRQPAHLRHIPRRLEGRGGLCTNCGFLLSSHSHTGRTEEPKFICFCPLRITGTKGDLRVASGQGTPV
ncbi:hypothetical protein PDJAM_G00187610 [Pangasius djambal]|uniref:Uncharacterized protein n=1 Tax=Pangasius djambal TaxID=1691987 RepID=A0ACC5Y532_9TELE|nr:hypothetical protein [Pangasius djambal]